MNAMKCFLYRFREELGIQCADRELFGSVFPELLDEDRSIDSQTQATSRYGKSEPRQLLSYVAKSPLLPREYSELRETIRIIGRHSHQGKAVPTDAIRRLTKRSSAKSYAGIFDSNLAELAQKSRIEGGDFDGAASPFLALFSQEDAKGDVRDILRKAWKSARGDDTEGFVKARNSLWRWCVHDVAKDQLAQYVRSLIVNGFRRDTILGTETVAHYRDGWNRSMSSTSPIPEEENYRRGLGFVFSNGFREDFTASLCETFPNADPFSENDFWSEMAALAAHYDDGEIDSKGELKVMVDAVTMCLLAAIVGPGSYSEELGWPLPGETETNTVKRATSGILRTSNMRLQPVILTGERSDTYFTQEGEHVSLKSNDKRGVRLGRDYTWLDGGASYIRFDDERVSRRHAEVFRDRGKWIARDLGSTFGTLVIKAPPRLPVLLHSHGTISETDLVTGDVIVIAPLNAAGDVRLPLGLPNRALRFEIECTVVPSGREE